MLTFFIERMKRLRIQPFLILSVIIVCIGLYRDIEPDYFESDHTDNVTLLSQKDGLFIKSTGNYAEAVKDDKVRSEHSPFFFRPVPVNEASRDLLATLPGVGEKTAAKIVQHRERNGNFRGAIDLRKVNGIGDRKLAEINKLVSY